MRKEIDILEFFRSKESSLLDEVVNLLIFSSTEKDFAFNLADCILVSLTVDQKVISQWFESSPNRAPRLAKALVDSGLDEEVAKQISNRMDRLSDYATKHIFGTLYGEEFDRQKIAILITDYLLYEKRRHQNYGLSIELADLFWEILGPFGDNSNCAGGTKCLVKGELGLMLVLISDSGNITIELTAQRDNSRLAELILLISDKKPSIVFEDDRSTIAFHERSEFQVCTVFSPWGAKKTRIKESRRDSKYNLLSSEVMLVPETINRVSEATIVFVPSSWLDRTAGTDGEFKRELILERKIQAVIQLPNKTLPGPSIPFALLVINTSKKNELVRFIDASGDKFINVTRKRQNRLANYKLISNLVHSEKSDESIAKDIPVQEILKTQANLSVGRFVVPIDVRRAENEIRNRAKQVGVLGDHFEIIRCQSIPQDDKENNEDRPSGQWVYELSPSNIDEYGIINWGSSLREVSFDTKWEGRIEQQLIRKDDILLSIKGSIGKCTHVEHAHENDVIASQSFVILRSKHKEIYPEVLVRFLNSSLGKILLSSIKTGSTVPLIKMGDLKKVIVPILSEQEQQKIGENNGNFIMEAKSYRKKKKELDRKVLEFWPSL